MIIKGYRTGVGYMGWVGNRYMLFPTKQEYIDYIKDMKS